MQYGLAEKTLKVTETGIEGHRIEQSHHDVNGKFGGYLAWIVHYVSDDEQQLEIYRHVGSYYHVGKWSGEPGPSKWSVVSNLIELLDEDMSIKKMMKFARLLVSYKKHRRFYSKQDCKTTKRPRNV